MSREIAAMALGVPLLALLSCGSAAPGDVVVFATTLRARGPNAMPDCGFEDGTRHWVPWKQGFERVEGPGAHSGNACARLTSTDPKLEHGVCQHVALDQREASLVIVEAWSRAENVSGGVNEGYSLYVDVEYQDGSHLWQQVAAFPVGTHGWVRREVAIAPEKPIKLLLVYGLLRGHTGTAWFDDFAVRVPKQGGLFDGTPIVGRPTGAERGPAKAAVQTPDGLRLGLDDAGRVTRVAAKEDVTDAELVATSGFLLRDVAAGSGFVRPATTVTSKEGAVHISAASDDMGLTLEARLAGDGDRIAVSGTVADTSGTDRCVSVYFALPLKLDGATWWDGVADSRQVKPGGQYGNWANVGVGANGFISKYPWSALTTGVEGLSLCVPMDRPQLVRMGVSAGLTYIVFDVGLSAKTTTHPSRAHFEFALYRHDPTWGFRDAARRYYAMFPQCFAKRATSEGIWLITRSIKAIRNPEDFHLKFHETGDRNVPLGAKLGIQSFRYTEPWRWRQRYSKKRGEGTAEQRSPEGTLAILENALTSKSDHIRRHSWAVKGAVCHDESGKPVFYIEDAPWGTSALFVCNPDPALPLVGPDRINQALCFYSPEIAKARYESGVVPEQDGEYIDSVEGFTWPRVRNYREEHFACADYPLVFGTQSRRVCLLNAFSYSAFLKYVADDLHRRGKLMFGNYLPNYLYLLTPHFDVLGTEHHWINRKGEWRPEAASRTDYRRALTCRKPYLMLLNTDFSKMSYAAVEKYMRRCAFWGMFPSMFSSDAFHDRYFDDPKYYDRDRPLFKKYVPIILDMAKAGWCPIPHARCADTAVRLERFGQGDSVFLSVLNTDKEKGHKAQITLDAKAMGLRSGALEVTELFSGRKLAIAGNVVSLEIAADDVAVLRLGGR